MARARAATVTVALLLLGALHSSWGFWVPPTAGTQALRCFTPGHMAVCRMTASRLSMSGEDAGEAWPFPSPYMDRGGDGEGGGGGGGRERGGGGRDRELQRGRESEWRSPRGNERRDWGTVRSGSQVNFRDRDNNNNQRGGDMNGPGYHLLGIENVGSNPASLPEVQLSSLRMEADQRGQQLTVGEQQQQQQQEYDVEGADDEQGTIEERGGSMQERPSGEYVVIVPVPIKVMMFIDGTWLYYSLFSRGRLRCPIIRRYGEGWTQTQRVDWGALSEHVGQVIAQQLPGRLVDMTRVVVYGSVRRETHPNSLRVRMFQEMQELNNFEVHLLTHQGEQEKCVDISLAVDMMHYATADDSYELCVLVTGDKDFMPAMSRVKQKGKRVVLTTMRNSCNRDLLDRSKHVFDFDPVFIDDALEKIIEPRALTGPGGSARNSDVEQALSDCVVELLESKGGKENLRDVGRHLQASTVGGRNALDLLREQYRNLRSFVNECPAIFTVHGPFLFLAGMEEDVGGEFLDALADDDDSFGQVRSPSNIRGGMSSSRGGGGGGGGNSKTVKTAFPVVRKSQRVEAEEEGGEGADDDEDGEERGDGVEGIGLSTQDWEVTSANDSEESDDDDGDGDGGNQAGDQALSLEDMDEDDLLELKIPELRVLLRGHGLRTTGNKAELVRRLLNSA